MPVNIVALEAKIKKKIKSFDPNTKPGSELMTECILEAVKAILAENTVIVLTPHTPQTPGTGKMS